MKTHSFLDQFKTEEDDNQSILSDSDDIVCSYIKCGKTYKEPIKVTNLSSEVNEKTYYACPHCLTKVNITDKKTQSQKNTATEENTEREETQSPECPYRFGYLKTRPKNAAIPDECLTCPKMIKCLI